MRIRSTRLTDWNRSIRLLCMAIILTAGPVTFCGCESNLRLRQKGYNAIHIGDYATARTMYQQAVRNNPTDAEAQYYLGVVEMKLDNPLRAQLAFERALELKPDDEELTPRILDKLAESLYAQDRMESLYAFLADTTATYGRTRDFLRQSHYMIRAGDLDGAKLALNKAAYFAEKDDITPYLAIADFYESINDVPNAVVALQYAYWVNPNYPGLANRFRQFGVVPGPTVAAEPPKPELLNRKYID